MLARRKVHYQRLDPKRGWVIANCGARGPGQFLVSKRMRSVTCIRCRRQQGKR